ncbi:MAG: hypothetical protein KAI40_05000 [Desulfobacterales bacterium]|nr:hypothetical protein [Desulfobacterales bacterium]
MKTKYLLISCCLFIFTLGCTTSGSKVITINYIGQNTASINENIGIAQFLNKRDVLEKGYIGKRILNSGSEELYFVKGLNIASTITEAFEVYFKKAGSSYKRIDNFEPSIEAIKKADKEYKYIIAGDIKEFEFFANKGFITSMVLDIKLIVYLGNVEKGVLTTIPVNLNLKRTDMKFSEKMVETFINESLAEVIIKAMASENL